MRGDEAKAWFLNIISQSAPLRKKLEAGRFGDVAKNVLGYYRTFLSFIVQQTAFAVATDWEWAWKRLGPVIGSQLLDPPSTLAQDYKNWPLVILLSGGGWGWFGDLAELRPMVVPPGPVKVFRERKKEVLLAATRTDVESRRMNGTINGCKPSPRSARLRELHRGFFTSSVMIVDPLGRPSGDDNDPEHVYGQPEPAKDEAAVRGAALIQLVGKANGLEHHPQDPFLKRRNGRASEGS